MSEVKESSIDSIQIGPDDTKATARGKVWDYLEKHGIALDPKARRRIFNFEGSEEASAKISELQVFKDATVVRIGPNDAMQEIRFRTLEAGKTLLVPSPRLMNHVVKKIIPPEDSPPEYLRRCAARQGMEQHSKAVDINEKLSVDVYIVGSVAVSPTGARLGKGRGSADLEYSTLEYLGAINKNVPVITLVHDCQVLDLPDSMFCSHDLPVDIIVTPTRVIECAGKLERPSGNLEELLSAAVPSRATLMAMIRHKRSQVTARIGDSEVSAVTLPSRREGKEVTDESQPQAGPSVQSGEDDPPHPKALHCGCRHNTSGLLESDVVRCNICGWLPLIDEAVDHSGCLGGWGCSWCPNVSHFPSSMGLLEHAKACHQCWVCMLFFEKL